MSTRADLQKQIKVLIEECAIKPKDFVPIKGICRSAERKLATCHFDEEASCMHDIYSPKRQNKIDGSRSRYNRSREYRHVFEKTVQGEVIFGPDGEVRSSDQNSSERVFSDEMWFVLDNKKVEGPYMSEKMAQLNLNSKLVRRREDATFVNFLALYAQYGNPFLRSTKLPGRLDDSDSAFLAKNFIVTGTAENTEDKKSATPSGVQSEIEDAEESTSTETSASEDGNAAITMSKTYKMHENPATFAQINGLDVHTVLKIIGMMKSKGKVTIGYIEKKFNISREEAQSLLYILKMYTKGNDKEDGFVTMN